MFRKTSQREGAANNQLAVGAAQVCPWLVAASRRAFGFLLFVLGELFVAVRIGIARRKHRGGTGGLFLPLAFTAKFVAHLANGRLDGFYFHEEIAYFFEEIVQMERTHGIGRARRFEGGD